MTVTLNAESKYGFSGQYIARITGSAAKFQFNREFVGNKHGKRNEGSSYETDEVGLNALVVDEPEYRGCVGGLAGRFLNLGSGHQFSVFGYRLSVRSCNDRLPIDRNCSTSY